MAPTTRSKAFASASAATAAAKVITSQQEVNNAAEAEVIASALEPPSLGPQSATMADVVNEVNLKHNNFYASVSLRPHESASIVEVDSGISVPNVSHTGSIFTAPAAAGFGDQTSASPSLKKPTAMDNCQRYGCPLCGQPFPRFPSDVLSALVMQASNCWKEEAPTDDQIFVASLGRSEDMQQLKAELCRKHQEDLKNDHKILKKERLQAMGIACPTGNENCVNLAPARLSPSLQRMIEEWKNPFCPNRPLLMKKICYLHTAESRFPVGVAMDWMMVFDEEDIQSRLDRFTSKLKRFASNPWGYHWIRFSDDRRHDVFRNADRMTDLDEYYAPGYYGPCGLVYVSNWLMDKFRGGKTLPEHTRLFYKNRHDNSISFLKIVLARYAIALLVTEDSSGKLEPLSEEMLEVLQYSWALGQAVNPILNQGDLHNRKHWQREKELLEKEWSAPARQGPTNH